MAEGNGFFSAFPLGTLLQSEGAEELRRACKAMDGAAAGEFGSLVSAALAVVLADGSGSGSSSSSSGLAAHACLARLPAPLPSECARALLALTLDFARCGVSGAAVRSALEDSGLSPAKAEAYAALYDTAYPGLRQALASAAAGACGCPCCKPVRASREAGP